MITDNTFIAKIGDHYFACIVSPTGTITTRTDVPEYETRFEEALNHSHHIALIPSIPSATYPTGKETPLQIAAAIMSISSQTQIVEAPDEVIQELKKIAGSNNSSTGIVLTS